MDYSNLYGNNALVKSILDYIRENHYEVGDRIPSERELAGALATNRNTLRESLRVLQSAGILEILPGSGTYLKESVSDFFSDSNYAKWIVSQKEKTSEMHQVRGTLDILAVSLVPLDQYQALANRLQDLIDSFHVDTCNGDDYIQFDSRFHGLIRQASGNSVLVRICDMLTGTLWDERVLYSHDPKRIEASYNEHKAIAAAFMTQNREFTIKVAEAHFHSADYALEEIQ